MIEAAFLIVLRLRVAPLKSTCSVPGCPSRILSPGLFLAFAASKSCALACVAGREYGVTYSFQRERKRRGAPVNKLSSGRAQRSTENYCVFHRDDEVAKLHEATTHGAFSDALLPLAHPDTFLQRGAFL